MQARRLPARQGLVWVIAGYRLFRSNMPLLSVLAFGYLVAVTMASILPGGIGVLLFLLVQPMLVLAIANGCRGIAKSGRLPPPPDLLDGIRTRRPQLIKLGALQLAGVFVAVLIVLAVLSVFSVDIRSDPDNLDRLLPVFALVALFALPLQLAFWFSPLLTGWHDIPPLKSAFFSLVAALRNWRAFAVYAVTLFSITMFPVLISLLAMQVSETFGQVVSKVTDILMLMLVLPIILAGTYVTYRDIFAEPAPPASTPESSANE